MNKTIVYLAPIALTLMLAGCQITEVKQETLLNQSCDRAKVFTAGFETVDTRTYVDKDLYMYWTAGDSLSIFTSTYNQQYRFDGKTGDTGGSFSKVNSGQFVSGNPVSNNYGVYPYNPDTRLTKDEKIELYLPQVQPYARSTFGVGANTMVAVTNGTSDTFLPFKNVCGYLRVRLHGIGKVKSLVFEGNNGEKISGHATVAISGDGAPIVTMGDASETSIRLDCGDGIELSQIMITDFWFVIPPTSFEKGFTISIFDERNIPIKKSLSTQKEITRNAVNSMASIEVNFIGELITSTEAAMQAIYLIHDLMHEGGTSFYGQGGYPTFCLALAFMSDDVLFSFSSPIFKDFQNWTEHRDLEHKYHTAKYYWDFFYRIISRANIILKYIDDEEYCPGDNGLRNYVKGQALAYRAFALFQLTQAWGERYNPQLSGMNYQPGVIISAGTTSVSSERSTVEECYAQINNDLDVAINCLSNLGLLSYFNDYSSYHINIWVAKGLKARVLLTMGRWAEAAAVADDVVTNSSAVLQPSTYTCGPFNYQMSNSGAAECGGEWLWGQSSSLFILETSRSLRDWHSFISNHSTSYNRNSPRAINSLLYKTIPVTDVRKNNWVEDPFSCKKGNVRDNTDKDGITLWVPIVIARICPYMSQKWLINDGGVQNTYFDVPYMRLPEMMLIAAEGYAKSNQPAKAQQLVYDLGHFRDPSYAMPTETGDALVEKIMWQRRVELWAEAGLRWLDLKRLNLPCDRGPKPREGYNQGGTANGWGTSMKEMPSNMDPEASNYNMYDEQSFSEAARYIPAGDPRWQWIVPTLE